VIDLGIGLGDAGTIALHAVIVVVSFLVLALVAGQTEHKLMAHMQGRLGPMYAGGFHGWAQLVADALKFMQKEEVVPAAVDTAVFRLAPAVAMIPYMIAMSVIPLSPTVVAANLDSGLFFVLAISAVGVLGTLMAGWASANKYALLGAMRSAAQLLAYELPVVLAAASVAMAAGSISLIGIATAWKPWWLLAQAPGMVAFFIGGMAEIQRPPFDMPVADSEIVVGPYTEYSGMRFALFLFAEYAGMVILAGMTAVLYFGGWQGPGPDVLGPFWTLAKVGALIMVIIWFRVSWPRMKEDQLQRLAWGILVPLALAQLGITSVLLLFR
jgi:NADH-quinone oxidoreductase subunit H